MADATRLVRDDAYDEMGSSYQCLQVATLDAALQENGIDDADVRRKVCESFLFAMGNFHDQYWMKPTLDGEAVYPLLCFSRKLLDTDTPVGELGEIFAPSAGFSFHEYAFGNASLLYDGDPNAHVETGVLEGVDDDV